jgi:hypothetical protein
MNLFQTPRYFQGLLALGTLLSAALVSHAQMIVPRDPNNPYQKDPRHKVRHVLVYDYSVPNVHLASRDAFRRSMERLAVQYGFRLDASREKDYITPSTLAGVDVVAFVSGDGDVLSGPASAATGAMKDFIGAQGKGLLMQHQANAFIDCPTNGQENLAHPDCLWLARVAVRQYFHQNSDQTPARIYADSVTQGSLPPHAFTEGDSSYKSLPAAIDHGRRNAETRGIFEGLPRNLPGGQPYVWDGVKDEWYNYRGNPRHQGAQVLDGVAFGPVNVLLSIDEGSYAEVAPSMGDHPVAWTRKVGKGLAVVNTAGHSDVYVRSRTVNTVEIADSLMEKISWRLLRYLARDFVGCTNPVFMEYNPEASVTTLTASDDPNPCKTVSSLRAGNSAFGAGISTRGGNIQITLAEPGEHVLRILDVSGRQALARNLRGQGTPVQISGLKAGIYFVNVTAPDGSKSERRVNLF